MTGNYLADGLVLTEYVGGVNISGNTIYQENRNGQDALIATILPTGVLPTAYSIDNNTYYQSKTVGDDFWMPGLGMTFAGWQSQSFDAHSSYTPTSTSNFRPTGSKIAIIQNQYDPNKALVIIYNWDHLSTVSIDLSGVLAPGDNYELRSTQDYFGDVTTATYAGPV